MTTQRRFDRRSVLGAIGVGLGAGLAGCLGDDTDDPEDAPTDEDAIGLEEPASFPDGEECAVCNMVAGEYPDWNAQLVFETGGRAYFCSSGCMAAYYAAPDVFERPDDEVAGGWVTDFETGELVDAFDAYYVRVTDPDHVDDIMMRNPTPFADRRDAEAFVEEFEEYDEDDVTTIEAFDRELAEFYRGDFFE